MGKLYPGDKGYPRGAKRYWAIERYAKAYAAAKAKNVPPWEDPATRAALGRLWYHRGRVPQWGLTTIEAIAWERESGRLPGYNNRHQRKPLVLQDEQKEAA